MHRTSSVSLSRQAAPSRRPRAAHSSLCVATKTRQLNRLGQPSEFEQDNNTNASLCVQDAQDAIGAARTDARRVCRLARALAVLTEQPHAAVGAAKHGLGPVGVPRSHSAAGGVGVLALGTVSEPLLTRRSEA